MKTFGQRPFQKAKLAEVLAPKCLKCAEPMKLRGLRIGRFYVRRVAQGWLCFKCEEAATQDSVGVRRQAYLTAAYPNGPRGEPVSHHKQLRPKFMPWLPVAAPGEDVQ